MACIHGVMIAEARLSITDGNNITRVTAVLAAVERRLPWSVLFFAAPRSSMPPFFLHKGEPVLLLRHESKLTTLSLAPERGTRWEQSETQSSAVVVVVAMLLP
jgi:hypothetical protein